MRLSRVLVFHAEWLHDDRIWKEVEQVAHRLSLRGMEATFFVYPFRSQVARRDITERVRRLARLGHEVGQHTHFYAGKKIEKPERIIDLSVDNIVHCLVRDFKTLQGMGFLPQGFTSGSWLVNEAVLNTLLELGFVYDCSARFPQANGMEVSLDYFWLRFPRIYTNAQHRLLCMPTTCSLGDWFKWSRRASIQGEVPYQLVYLHDYDLASFRNRLLLSCFLEASGKKTLKPLAAIAQEYRRRETNVHGSFGQV
jgi:hypothetical protein